MKISFIFKDPGALDDGLSYFPGDRTAVDFDSKVDGFDDICQEIREKYFEYGEYVNLEYDTETKEMRVVPISEN